MRPVWNRQEQIPVGSLYEILRISHLFYLGSVSYNRKQRDDPRHGDVIVLFVGNAPYFSSCPLGVYNSDMTCSDSV